MIAKKFAATAVAAALLAGVSVTALADTTQPTTTTPTTTSTTTGTTTTGTTADTAGLAPGSPLYFLDRLFESIQLFFTRDPEARVNLYVKFADERLSEFKLVTSQQGNTADQQAAAKQLVSDVVSNLSAADTSLETIKLDSGDVTPTATQVQQTATQTQVLIHQAPELPSALIPQILQTLNQIAQEAGALTQVKVEAVMQAKTAGVQPGKMAITVKMAENAGKPVTEVAPLLNTQSPTQVAQSLGLDPNTFTKLEIKMSDGQIKVEATGTGTTATPTTPTAAAADWNNQIALPGGVTKVLDYKFESEDGKVEYKVTYIDGAGRLVTYKYESKDGKVEAKLEVAGTKPGNSEGEDHGKGKALGKAKKGDGTQLLINITSGKGDEDKDHEHEDEHEEEDD